MLNVLVGIIGRFLSHVVNFKGLKVYYYVIDQPSPQVFLLAPLPPFSDDFTSRTRPIFTDCCRNLKEKLPSIVPCKGIRFPKSRKHLLAESISGVRENFVCGIRNPRLWIRNTARGIRNPTNDCNPESKFH